MIWEAALDNIRQGKVPVEVGENGIPTIAQNAPVFELFQFVAALAAGYNRNVKRLETMRKTLNANIKNGRSYKNEGV